MNPGSYLIFDKGAQSYDGEKTAFSTNVPGKALYVYRKLKHFFHYVQVSAQSELRTLI
jgi:hypothetical protein